MTSFDSSGPDRTPPMLFDGWTFTPIALPQRPARSPARAVTARPDRLLPTPHR